MIKGICLYRFHAAADRPKVGDETGSRHTYYPPHPQQEPGLTLRRTDSLCNERIGGVAPGAGSVHQDEDNQVNQRQLTCGKGIAAVYRKESHTHRKDHRDQRQPVE